MRTNIASLQTMAKLHKENTPAKMDKIFHTSAGTKNAGMYHPDNISSDGKALVPRVDARQILQKKADQAFIKKADKKLKGFKFGVGVGP